MNSIPSFPVPGHLYGLATSTRIHITGRICVCRYKKTSKGIGFVKQLQLEEHGKTHLAHKSESLGTENINNSEKSLLSICVKQKVKDSHSYGLGHSLTLSHP